MQGNVKLIGDWWWAMTLFFSHISSTAQEKTLQINSWPFGNKRRTKLSFNSTHTLSLSQLLPAKMLPTKGHKEKNFHLQLHSMRANANTTPFSLSTYIPVWFSTNNPPLLNNILPFFKNISFCNCLFSLHCFPSQESLSLPLPHRFLSLFFSHY